MTALFKYFPNSSHFNHFNKKGGSFLKDVHTPKNIPPTKIFFAEKEEGKQRTSGNRRGGRTIVQK